jgi:hypothetical protein
MKKLILTFFILSAIIKAQPQDSPISPNDYANILGKGFDVNWTKSFAQAQKYNEDLLKKIKVKGFNHIRLRTNLESSADYISISENIVNDCLNNNITPILAFGGKMLEENPDSENIANFIEWWRAVAEHYKDYSYRLTFNLLIEISGKLKNMPDTLNLIYEKTVSVIRESNPNRIVILGPRKLSNPFYLHELKIPSQANGYIMWEWHFYASGPAKTGENKLWTTGTPEEKKLITDKIDAALDWEHSSGFPSWVGAWMPGNYNDGNDYTVPEQVIFSSFMIRELNKAHIPWAVNALHHFNNYIDGSNEWIQSRLPVLDVIIDPWKVSFYSEMEYGGISKRIGEGYFNKQDLADSNIFNNINSVMVPADFKIYLYSGEEFDGEEKIVTRTNSNIFDSSQSFSVQSIKIIYDTTTTIIDEHGKDQVSQEFILEQNYPNPFNPTTTIEYSISPHSSSLQGAGVLVSLKVYDILGKEVATLINRMQKSGNYKVEFDASNLSSGIYFYRISFGNFTETKRMVLLK